MDDNVDEFRDERSTGLGDPRSDKSSKSRVVARQNQPLTTSPRIPTVQEIANEIMRQMNVNQRPPVRIKPLRQQALYPNNPTP